jgi:ribonucleoside-triphosphate reductase
MSDEKREPKVCGMPCEVYSRIVGYFRPVQRWNPGKQEEFKLRTTFDVKRFLRS